jgi:hypothetical protein
VLLLVIGALSSGCGDEGEPSAPASNVTEQQPREDAEAAAAARRERRAARRERARIRQERAQLRRERAQARRERARARALVRAAARERRRQARLEAEAIAAEEAAPAEPAASCHPSYDPCLDPNAGDYDCEGGEGDGPEYTGLVTVTGSDDYDLDRDGDGTGCDS